MSTISYTRSVQSVLDEIDLRSSDILGSLLHYQNNPSLENTRDLVKKVEVFVENDNLQKSITILMSQTFNKQGVEQNEAMFNGYLLGHYQSLFKKLKDLLSHRRIQNIHAPFVTVITGARKKKIKKMVNIIERVATSSDGLVGITEIIYSYYQDKQELVIVTASAENGDNRSHVIPHERKEQPPPWFGFDEDYDY